MPRRRMRGRGCACLIRIWWRAAQLLELGAPFVAPGSDVTALLLAAYLRPGERVTIIGLRPAWFAGAGQPPPRGCGGASRPADGLRGRCQSVPGTDRICRGASGTDHVHCSRGRRDRNCSRRRSRAPVGRADLSGVSAPAWIFGTARYLARRCGCSVPGSSGCTGWQPIRVGWLGAIWRRIRWSLAAVPRVGWCAGGVGNVPFVATTSHCSRRLRRRMVRQEGFTTEALRH